MAFNWASILDMGKKLLGKTTTEQVVDGASKVAGASGSGTLKKVASGASLGATIGSIIPGVGTVIGGAIGAVGGFIAGLFGKKKKKPADGGEVAQKEGEKPASDNSFLGKLLGKWADTTLGRLGLGVAGVGLVQLVKALFKKKDPAPSVDAQQTVNRPTGWDPWNGRQDYFQSSVSMNPWQSQRPSYNPYANAATRYNPTRFGAPVPLYGNGFNPYATGFRPFA